MPDIFLSYNREDQPRATLFAEAFKAQGFDVWWDTTLRTGEAYDQVTEKALKEAKAVVVLWSKKSVASRWVRAEATLADRNKTLLPVMIEACERPIMFELTQTAELSHWQGAPNDHAWRTFLADVKGFVAKDSAPVNDNSLPMVAAPSVQETLKPGQSGSAPSLAVLPFINRSILPEDEVFAEGMVDDIISALSQGVNVRVLGSTATANLSRTVITDLAAVGRQLGVRYLLEGNVRRVGASLRVTTQLLEAATGEVLWTARFDRSLTELAELQEELVTEIAARLDTQVYSLEVERALNKPGDITAWEAVARSMAAYRRMDLAAMQLGIEESKRAVATAPNYGPAHAALATNLLALYVTNEADDPSEVQRIRAIAERAVVLAPEDAIVLGWAGNVHGLLGYPEEGIRYTERAVRKSPGHGLAHHLHGTVCFLANRSEEALSHFETATRLMPGSFLLWLVKMFRSAALAELGLWPEADAAIDESIVLNPTLGQLHSRKAVICARMGRDAEARGQIDLARRLGCNLAMAEQWARRLSPHNSTREADIATIRGLYAATEPGA